jgi:hypothetical protein
MRCYVIELHEHTLDSNVTTIERASVDNSSVATVSKNDVSKHLKATNANDTIPFLNFIRYNLRGLNIRFQAGLRSQAFDLFNNLLSLGTITFAAGLLATTV